MNEMEALDEQRLELVTKIQEIDLDLTRRKHNLDDVRERVAHADPRSYQEARRDYERWRSGALTARHHALNELIKVKAMIKATNVENRDDERGRLRLAIMAHQQEVMDGGYAATPADLKLWAELDKLS
jgi:hypothetical protein